MRITHVQQPLQGPLDPLHSVYEHLLTIGRKANRTTEKAKAIADDRYVLCIYVQVGTQSQADGLQCTD